MMDWFGGGEAKVCMHIGKAVKTQFKVLHALSSRRTRSTARPRPAGGAWWVSGSNGVTARYKVDKKVG
jgi:hypothetical protein